MHIERVVRAVAWVAVLVASLAVAPMTAAAATAAQAPPAPLQVPLSATEPSGPGGLAVLTAAESATTVQVLVQDAPEGAIATIHPGTCAELESGIVGLVGELGAGGQAQAIVPVPLSSLADGGHAVALHPGLDFTTTLACGAIPQVAALPPAPEPLPEPVPEPEPPPDPPEPDADPECVGVPEWLTATRARFDELSANETELSRVSADPAAYAAALGEQIGRVNAMIAEMQAESVPTVAAAGQRQLLGGLQTGIQAARELIESYATGGTDPVSAGREDGIRGERGDRPGAHLGRRARSTLRGGSTWLSSTLCSGAMRGAARRRDHVVQRRRWGDVAR